MEFKSELDIHIAQKMLKFPMLGERVAGAWNLVFATEFHMTNDSNLFKTAPASGRLPLYEGKMIWHYEHGREPFRYWLDRKAVIEDETNRRTKQIAKFLLENDLLPAEGKLSLKMPFEHYRLGFRSITGSTNERALVVSVLPLDVVTGNSLTVSKSHTDSSVNGVWQERPLYSPPELLAIVAMMASFTCDWFIRQKMLTNMNMFLVYQIPMPRITKKDSYFSALVSRSAKLICITPEFDALAKGAGLRDHCDGVTDPIERANLRAEIDGLVAHLYGLTESEFAHILSTFPLVDEQAKAASMGAYRKTADGQFK